MKLKMDFLNHRQMELILVQGYKGIKDKEKANEYAVNGSSWDKTTACNDTLTPSVFVANSI